MAAPSLEQIRRAPKVVLHDHLDGGLRARTVVDLARDAGHTLPTTDPDELARWFTQGAYRHDLDLYLETFEHTVGVMQTKDALVRVAAECAEDLAADGVVYAEVRFAPELHIEGGLSLDEVVEAVLEGFRLGGAGRAITIGTLATAMRHAANSSEIAELALRHRDDGVVGFDIAGSEAGNPRPATWPRSRRSPRPTATSRSTRARRSASRRSGRRCSCAAPSAWATGSASSTTSRSIPTAGRGWAAWRRSSGTAGWPWRCARRPTSTPASRRRSRNTRSASSSACASG